MIRSYLIVPVLMTIALISGNVANASTIDYKVNLTIGGGTVTGDIFTDGTIGPLVQSNITNWVLTLNDGVDPAITLLGPLSGNNSIYGFNRLLDTADPLNALASGQLTWTFARTPATDPAERIFFNSADNQNKFVFFNSVVTSQFGPQLILNGPTSGISELHQPDTTVVIGTAVSAATVPEPASLTLTALGLGALARSRRRLHGVRLVARKPVPPIAEGAPYSTKL